MAYPETVPTPNDPLTEDTWGQVLNTAVSNIDSRLNTAETKLAGVEAGADVTDAANVTAAGALMDSEVSNLAAVKAFSPADYATAAQGATADTATQPGDDADTLGSGAAADGTVLTADGSGNAAWEVPFDPHADQNIVIDGVDGDFYWRGQVVTGRPSGLPTLTRCIWNTQRDPGFVAADFAVLSPAPTSYDGWVESA